MDREPDVTNAFSSCAEPASAPLARPRAGRMPNGRIFNIQRFSTEDGPGIRTTVFVKGCPLTCLWCSNPESQYIRPELGHSDAVCDRCGQCVPVCEHKAIEVLDTAGIRINRELCDNCGKCVDVCGPRGLRMMGRELTVDEVFDEIQQDSIYYRNSGGGVTCSGGEPLTQPQFVTELFRRCHAAGIHTTLDTSGYGPEQAVKNLLEYTDLVLFDLKLMDNQAHEKVVGKPNRLILANARHVAASGVEMIIRVPLISGVTDTEDNITALAQFVQQLRPGLTVNVLPYHRFGMNKYQMLDREYPMGDAKSPPMERVTEIIERFESFGLACEIVS